MKASSYYNVCLTLFFAFSFLLFKGINNFAQDSNRIIQFDLFNEARDTLEIVTFDTTITSECTNYFVGNYDNEYNILNMDIPVESVFSESHFTLKRKATLDYDINKFPIRTSVKLFKWVNDSLKSKCSGTMISKKHVLTACHCVAKQSKDSLLYDSLYVSPVYDNGEFSPLFNGSWVEKIYFFENWNSYKDFSILELEKPIGEKTGWISIGFNSDDEQLLDGIFYKFSYPSTTILQFDSNMYNGNYLYYNYGLADIVGDYNLGINNASGIPGESGSSLIKIDNWENYTSYGVLSFSTNLHHCKINNWHYFAFKAIIGEYLSVENDSMNTQAKVFIYPNPVDEILLVENNSSWNKLHLKLFDIIGNVQRDIITNKRITTIEMNWISGLILVLVENESGQVIMKEKILVL